MNNLGGFKRVELLFADEISVFSRSGYSVKIERTNNFTRHLSLHDDSSLLVSTPKSSDSGTIYEHKCTLSLRTKGMPHSLISLLQQVKVRGCILIATTSNDEIRVFGSKEYPLLGNLIEEYGSSRKELHQHKLSLSSNCLHPELVLL